MTETPITPHEILAQLKEQGVVLRMDGQKLLGPKGMTPEQRSLVSTNKAGLIVALTYVCPIIDCNAPVRVFDRSGYWSLECPSNPLHYSEILNKTPGQPMGLVRAPLTGSLFGEESK